MREREHILKFHKIKNDEEVIFEETMTKYFPKLLKIIKLQIQKAQWKKENLKNYSCTFLMKL